MSGGGVGGGVGATLGGIVAAALAPETGGASLLADAALTGLGSAAGGALGGAAGAAVTGGNVGQSALSGGITGAIGGLLGGGVSGLLGSGADAADSGSDLISGSSDTAGGTGTTVLGDSGSAAGSSGGSGSATLGDTGSLPVAQTGNLNGMISPGMANDPGTFAAPATNVGGSGTALPSNAAASQPWYKSLNPFSSSSSAAPASQQSTSNSSGLSSYLIPAAVGAGATSLLFPQGSNPVNTSASTNALNSFNTPLPQYNYNSIQTPYTGNWYTYGQRPEAPQISNTVTPATPVTAARGGLINGYAQGGRVRGLAMGGQPMQAPMMPQQQQPMAPPQSLPIPQTAMLPRPAGMPPQGVAMQQQQATPRQQAARFEIGRRIGNELRKHIVAQSMTPNGIVKGGGKGQDDVIPARLSKDEYVIPADIPSFLGDGSSDAGSKVLDKMVSNIREQKTSKGSGFPPRAKSPLAYIKGA